MALISVIVPVYKVEPYLRRCVDSILKQTFTDFELILVDDGSPDKCGEICDEYASKDNRIHVIHQDNNGLSAARNAGIDWTFENSDSEWISFVDSDDWVACNYLQALFQGVIESRLSVSACAFIKTKKKIEDEQKELQFDVLNTETYYVTNRTNFIIAWGKLYKKECFRKIRYPVGKIHEDEFVTYLILFQFSQISVINSPLYYYQINDNGIMHSSSNHGIANALEALDEQLLFFKKNGLKNAYYTSIVHYINTLSALLRDDQNNEYAIKTIKKILYKHILKTRFFIKQIPWACELAYPFAMRMYWTIMAHKKQK